MAHHASKGPPKNIRFTNETQARTISPDTGFKSTSKEKKGPGQ